MPNIQARVLPCANSGCEPSGSGTATSRSLGMHATRLQTAVMGHPGLCVREQTRWRLAETMNALPSMSLKGANMIEKTASVHWAVSTRELAIEIHAS